VDKEVFGNGSFFHSGHRSYVGPGLVRFDQDLAEEVETLFELCPDSLAFRSEIRRGLQAPRQNRYWHMTAPLLMLGHYTRRSGAADRIVMRGLRRELRRMSGEGPRFIFLPLLDVDTRTHAYGPLSPQVAAAYREVDQGIGAIIRSIQERGLWSRTLVVLSSDHGHTATREHLDLSRLVERAGYRVFEYPMVHRRNCTAAVMISGNALAHIYLASEGRWEGPLHREQVEREHGSLLQRLRGQEAIDWIAYRQNGSQVVVETGEGRALLGREDGAYTYQVDGPDPLRLGLTHTRVPLEQALALTWESPFPDALEQLWHLFRSARTGDVVVTARPGHDLRARYEWPEHHSSHGSLCRDQMLVPIISNRPLDGGQPIRTADLFPTIAQSLGVKPQKPHFGRSLIC
jgi:arylsulfatase A-like enzyme